MKTRAAVAFESGKPLEIVEVDLEGPKAGEVLVEIKLREFVIQMHLPCQATILRVPFQQF